MPQPTALAIATSSLQRLVKEEASYHSELQMQQKSIDRLESSRTTTEEDAGDDEGNQEFLLRQEVCLFLIPSIYLIIYIYMFCDFL